MPEPLTESVAALSLAFALLLDDAGPVVCAAVVETFAGFGGSGEVDNVGECILSLSSADDVGAASVTAFDACETDSAISWEKDGVGGGRGGDEDKDEDKGAAFAFSCRLLAREAPLPRLLFLDGRPVDVVSPLTSRWAGARTVPTSLSSVMAVSSSLVAVLGKA